MKKDEDSLKKNKKNKYDLNKKEDDLKKKKENEDKLQKNF
jgi:hypothetical protein